MKRLLVSVIACLMLIQTSGAAPATLFQVLEPAPLVVRGVVDGITSEWSALVRVQAGSQPVGAILALPSDLLLVNDPTTRIERSNVQLQNADGLSANEIRDLRLSVRAVPQAGTYAGTVQLVAQGAAITTALTLDLRVELTPKISITPVDTALTLNTTNCFAWCGLAATKSWFVYLEHHGTDATAITSATVLLRGQHTGTTVNPAVFQTILPLTLNGDGDTPLQTTVGRNRLPADQYTGLLRLQTRTGTMIAPIAFTLNVKHSLVWALLAILLGIMIGRFVRFMQSPEVQRGISLFKELDPVRVIATALGSSPNRTAVEQQIMHLEQRIDDPRENAETLRTAIHELQSRTIILRDLQTLHQHLQELKLGKVESTREFIRLLDAAEKAAKNGSLDDAKTTRAALYTEWQTIVNAQPQSKDINDPPVEATPLPNLKQPTIVDAPRTRWQRWLETLVGIASPASAKARYRLYRPLAGAVFLLVLVVVGLQTKYAAAPTFGAQWSDYWDIFLWGVTADVVNRALIGQLGGSQAA